MRLAELSKLDHAVVAIFAYPAAELRATIPLLRKHAYVFGRQPDLATPLPAVVGRQFVSLKLEGDPEDSDLSRVEGVLLPEVTGVRAISLSPNGGTQVQDWGADVDKGHLEPGNGRELGALTCLWTPSPGHPRVERYQLLVVNPIALRVRDSAYFASVEARQATSSLRQVEGLTRVRPDPSPTDRQLEAIVRRMGPMLALPPRTMTFAATGKEKADDRALDALAEKVRAHRGLPKASRKEAVSWLVAEGYLPLALIERTAKALGSDDIDFGWLEARLAASGAPA